MRTADGPTPGRVRWIRAIGRVTFDGERASRFDGVTIDVTDRRGAEAALSRTRRQLDVILANVAEGVTAHDRDGRLLFGNDAAARIAGYEGAVALLADD